MRQCFLAGNVQAGANLVGGFNGLVLMCCHVLGVAALSLAFSGAALAEEVRVFNWSDYIDEDLLTKFEAETGIKVIYDVFDSNEVLETKMLAGSTGYDIVVPSGTFLSRQIQAGVFQKLDKSQLPNLTNVWDDIAVRTAVYDHGNEYSINYMWGTTGIGYNVEAVRERLGDDAPTDSWALVFDPQYAEKLADCGISLLDAPSDMLQSAMAFAGVDPTSTDPADLEKGAEVLMAVRPFVRYFHSSQYISDLANGEV